MLQWLKKKNRLVFNSGTVQLQEDFHGTIHSTIEAIRYYARRDQLIDHILHDTQSGITKDRYTDHDIVVSLTSYGTRIHEAPLAIESLMQQTMKPNRIVLWLDNSFKEKRLPHALLMQQDRGLEISFCSDIRSYKKLIPQMRQTPLDAIITADDDILYDYDVLEHLILAYLNDPQKIHCCRAHRITLNSEGRILPYSRWETRVRETGTNKFLFLTSGGGVIFPPGSLDSTVFDEETFMAICPDADDVWFTAMALKKNTPISKVFTRNKNGEDYMENRLVSGERLSHNNVTLQGNDRQIQAVFSKYSLYDMLFCR